MFQLRKLKPKEIKDQLQGQQDAAREKSGGSSVLLLCWLTSWGGNSFRGLGLLNCL